METPPIDRRHFLGTAGATAAFFAMHGGIHGSPLAAGQAGAAPQGLLMGRPRILSLELLSGASMSEMKAFYGKTLDLAVRDERDDRFTVEAGETPITFIDGARTAEGRAPFYHFAFNIPQNKILKALEWQKARTPMLNIPERNRAAGYPPEVVDYSHWNAHSIFFLDPAGNIVEYIARHDLKDGDNSPFSWADIQYVSEIGLIVDDVPATAAMLEETADVGKYKGASEDFIAMGDEYGLLLVMKRGRVLDFTSNPDHGAQVYRTGVTVRGTKIGQRQIGAYPYVLNVEERCACA